MLASRIAREKSPKRSALSAYSPLGVCIEIFAIEELRAVDKIELHSIRFAAVHDTDKTVVVKKGDSEALDRYLEFLEMFLYLAIERQIHSHLVALAHNLARQRAYDVCNSSRLGIGNALRRGKNNMHGSGSFVQIGLFRMMQRRKLESGSGPHPTGKPLYETRSSLSNEGPADAP